MRSANVRRLPEPTWADDRARRVLVLPQLALIGMVPFDILIPRAIRSIVDDAIRGEARPGMP